MKKSLQDIDTSNWRSEVFKIQNDKNRTPLPYPDKTRLSHLQAYAALMLQNEGLYADTKVTGLWDALPDEDAPESTIDPVLRERCRTALSHQTLFVTWCLRKHEFDTDSTIYNIASSLAGLIAIGEMSDPYSDQAADYILSSSPNIIDDRKQL